MMACSDETRGSELFDAELFFFPLPNFRLGVLQIDIVLIGAHAVMANGGIIAPLGSHTLALAAQKHGVSVVVLAGLHKVCVCVYKLYNCKYWHQYTCTYIYVCMFRGRIRPH